MTLWAIARSPLIHGGDMTKMDAFTLSLPTNAEVIAVDRASAGNRPLFERDGLWAWVASVPGSPDRYLALFNTRDPFVTGGQPAGATIRVTLSELGLLGRCRVRDLWQGRDLAPAEGELASVVAWHGAALYRLSSGACRESLDISRYRVSLYGMTGDAAIEASPAVFLHSRCREDPAFGWCESRIELNQDGVVLGDASVVERLVLCRVRAHHGRARVCTRSASATRSSPRRRVDMITAQRVESFFRIASSTTRSMRPSIRTHTS